MLDLRFTVLFVHLVGVGRDIIIGLTHRVYFVFCVDWEYHSFHEQLEDQDKLATGDSLVIALPHIQPMHREEHYVRKFRVFVDTVELISAPLVVRYAGDLVFIKLYTRPFSIPAYVKRLSKNGKWKQKILLGAIDHDGWEQTMKGSI